MICVLGCWNESAGFPPFPALGGVPLFPYSRIEHALFHVERKMIYNVNISLPLGYTSVLYCSTKEANITGELKLLLRKEQRHECEQHNADPQYKADYDKCAVFGIRSER